MIAALCTGSETTSIRVQLELHIHCQAADQNRDEPHASAGAEGLESFS